MTRPSALPLLLVTLWAEARLWPRVARARVLEARALAVHLGLLCPAREHDLVVPEPITLRKLLETAALNRELRGLSELSWQVELLINDLAFAGGAL